MRLIVKLLFVLAALCMLQGVTHAQDQDGSLLPFQWPLEREHLDKLVGKSVKVEGLLWDQHAKLVTAPSLLSPRFSYRLDFKKHPGNIDGRLIRVEGMMLRKRNWPHKKPGEAVSLPQDYYEIAVDKLEFIDRITASVPVAVERK